MTTFLIILLIFIFVAVMGADYDCDDKDKAKRNLNAMKDFILYCHEFKHELPKHIREEFDDMEKVIISDPIEE